MISCMGLRLWKGADPVYVDMRIISRYGLGMYSNFAALMSPSCYCSCHSTVTQSQAKWEAGESPEKSENKEVLEGTA